MLNKLWQHSKVLFKKIKKSCYQKGGKQGPLVKHKEYYSEVQFYIENVSETLGKAEGWNIGKSANHSIIKDARMPPL